MEFDPTKPRFRRKRSIYNCDYNGENASYHPFQLHVHMNTQPVLTASKAHNEKQLEHLIASFVQQVNELNDMSLQHVSIYLHGKEGCFNELPPADIAKPLDNNVTYREMEVAAPVHNRIYLISRG